MRRRDQENANEAGPAPRRGWGPFSGAQLTTIIVTVVLAVGFPVAAFAVTGTAMNITDPVTAANKAKVDAKGNLFATLHDNASGLPAKVDAKNNLNTATRDAATGAAAHVDSRGQQLVYAQPSFALPQINPGLFPQPIYGSTGTVLAIHVDTYARTGAGAIQFSMSPDNCSTLSSTVDSVDPADLGVTTLEYGTGGLSIPSGSTLCVTNTSPANVSAAVFVFMRLT